MVPVKIPLELFLFHVNVSGLSSVVHPIWLVYHNTSIVTFTFHSAWFKFCCSASFRLKSSSVQFTCQCQLPRLRCSQAHDTEHNAPSFTLHTGVTLGKNFMHSHPESTFTRTEGESTAVLPVHVSPCGFRSHVGLGCSSFSLTDSSLPPPCRRLTHLRDFLRSVWQTEF